MKTSLCTAVLLIVLPALALAQTTNATLGGTVSDATQKRATPFCSTPIRKRKSIESPGARGVALLTALTEYELL